MTNCAAANFFLQTNLSTQGLVLEGQIQFLDKKEAPYFAKEFLDFKSVNYFRLEDGELEGRSWNNARRSVYFV